MNIKQLWVAAIICMMSIFSYTAMAQEGTNTLSAGQKLTEGQRLISANKVYYLAIQADGNLCLKKTKGDEFVWCSMVNLGSGHHLTLQADGNLVVYNKDNKSVWNSMTQAFYDSKFGSADGKPVRAVLEDNGTLNLYSSTNKKVWDNTYKGEQPKVPATEGFTGPTVKRRIKVLLPNSETPKDIVVEVTNTGQVFYDGDINLGTLDKVTQQASAPADNNSRLWPNSTVPYVLSTNHPRYDVIKKGIDEMNLKTNICLVPRTNQTDYIEFVSKGGNWSALGRVGGRQEISIENKVVGTVCHEIMHALGFYHTQSREDRDNYVTINMGNVQKGFEANFQKESDKASNLGVYDFGSCLHYHAKSFAVDNSKNTISLKNAKGDEDKIMGQRDSMSHMDIINISDVYAACPTKANKKPYVTKATANLPSSVVAPNNNTGTQPAVTATASASSGCEAREAVKKYQNSMKPGERLSEKEKLVSANGRFHFRVTTDGNFVIEEIQNSNNCQFREVYRFPLNNGGGRPNVSFFSYNPDGNLCMDTKQGKTHCATTGRDATAAVILHKSAKLELTNDGRLRLINKDGQEIWTTPLAPQTNATTQPATQPNPTAVAPDQFVKSKPILNHGEDLKMGQTLTSENGQYQARLIKQQIDIGAGRMQEQNRFIIDRITVVNGMITNRVELWNKECKEGAITGNDKNRGASVRFQDCFYDAPLPSGAIHLRTGIDIHFGQIKLENDGSLNIIYNGYYRAKLCPVGDDEISKTEFHYRTPSELYAGRVEHLALGRLEIGKTLTSDNNQFQARITPEKRFVIERITVGTKENGEKFVASRDIIWDKECKEGFIEIKPSSVQPDCFKKEVPVIDTSKPYRIPLGTAAHHWKLENDGTIKWYVSVTDKTGYVTCNPYK